jgi:GH35 family endo-1,4-beta-xylanase
MLRLTSLLNDAFKTRFKYGLLGLLMAIAFCLLDSSLFGQITHADVVDQRIRQNRTGDLVVQVVDAQGGAIANASITIEQTAHYFPFGTALSSEIFQSRTNPVEQKQYLKLAKQLFNASVHENALKWYATEPNKGQISYADADRILQWSEQNRLRLRGHTLFWAVEKWNQPWVRALNNQELRQAVQHRTIEICTRYRGRITEYDVMNEMLHGDFYQKRLGDRIVDDIFKWCKQADPNARLYVNDYNILNGQELDRYVEQIRSLLKRGVPLGGIGVQGHIREAITTDRIQKSLDTLAQFKLPIKITEFDVVADSEVAKARVLKDVYQVAFSHPAVAGILMWGFWAGAHWEPAAAIYKRNFQLTPAAIAYHDLVFNQWWTKASGQTNQSGQFSTRAFLGQFQVTVKLNGQSIQQSFTLTPSTKTPLLIRL